MGTLSRFLQPLICNINDRIEIEKLKKEREKRDKKIDSLERITLNGETEWMMRIVKRDPSCAIRILKECDND